MGWAVLRALARVLLAIVVVDTDWHAAVATAQGESSRGETVRLHAALAEGTPYATPVYLLGEPANGVVLVTGGVHGDEPAGFVAAQQLVDRAKPFDGLLLVVIPLANRPAAARGTRTADGHGDLNRSFPGDPGGALVEQLAHRILALIDELGVTFVIDLHESARSIFDDPSRLGDTVIINRHHDAVLAATGLQAWIRIERPDLRLGIEGPAAAGSLVDAAGRMGVPGVIVESDRSQELNRRVDYQHTVLGALLRLLVDAP